MFKRQKNESTYDKIVTVPEMVFHKMDICLRDFGKNLLKRTFWKLYGLYFRWCYVTDGLTACSVLHVARLLVR